MLPALTLLLCVVLRLVPHPPNVAPVGAAAVFAGRTLPFPLAIALTLLAMFLGDVGLALLRGYPLVTGATPFIYAGFVLQIVLGRALRNVRGGAVAAAATGAVGFFLISNLGVWLGTAMYPRTLAGLGSCYSMALPFLGNTLAGDVLWTVALTLAYGWIAKRLESRGRGAAWVPVASSQMAAV